MYLLSFFFLLNLQKTIFLKEMLFFHLQKLINVVT